MSIAAELERIERQLHEVEALIAEGDARLAARAAAVSGWSVGEQVDHILKVLDRSLGLLLTSEEALPKGINLVGRILLAARRLPRGVGKSPAALRGAARPAGERRAQLDRIAPLLERVRDSPERFMRPTPIYPHPYFGGLRAAQAVRFLAVHTDHHLRIVADIRRAAGV
jgi:hypothetical protein